MNSGRGARSHQSAGFLKVSCADQTRSRLRLVVLLAVQWGMSTEGHSERRHEERTLNDLQPAPFPNYMIG